MAGHALRGTVVRVLPFGAFVGVGDGVVGLVPFKVVHGRPAAGTPEVFQAGAEGSAVVASKLPAARAAK
ncbi:S1 RNA-binding domain-containing protein [Kitasatospora sp. NPDC048540]|uniref:S1 RNA-binding domain-containing protein n=1 Tax=Kitasatospora sp. NPDC048540 TaxID=3155634 RepID=UPI0033DC8B4B